MPVREGVIAWLTGLSGAGKSTLARAAARRLGQMGWTTEIIDGDEVRRHLSAGLGFSPRDREENVRRAACLAGALARRYDFVMVALIAPYRDARAEVASSLPNYLEIFVNAPLSVCEARDPTGLYRRARSGKLMNFTGIDAPYEPPLHPALEIRTDRESVEHSVERLIGLLTGGRAMPGLADLSRVDSDGWPAARVAVSPVRNNAPSIVLRFRVPAVMKERFGEIAASLGTSPSVLMRKFVAAAVNRPAFAERIYTARLVAASGKTECGGADGEPIAAPPANNGPRRGHKVLPSPFGGEMLSAARPGSGPPEVIRKEKEGP